jgi:cell division septation protein DedD
VIILAIVSGVAIAALAAIVLALIGAGRATMRDISRQVRVVSPPNPPKPKDGEEAYLAGPPFASDGKAGS